MLLKVLDMGLKRYSIGQLVDQTTETNEKELFGVNDVRGMTITKQIIPTKADTSNTDLRKYLVIHPNEFIYNPRTHGKHIGFGYNDTGESFIISWNNIGFRIKKEMQDVVLPTYLFLHFVRDEWDREACFRSWGSSTEVFSWNALCEMEVDLPSLTVQQKYVDIYKAMVANQHSYECGLEDLKLAIDITIDKLKNAAHRARTGALLCEVDNRNTDNSIVNVQGININKQFMPTVANTTGTNLANYKVVTKGQFAFSGMQTGRDMCIRIALYDKEEPIIISPAYTVLQINSSEVIPEYVMIWFSRKESDRFGWFLSDASIRSNLDLDSFFDTKIPLPDISIQKAIAEMYNVYTTRKQINEQLKEQIKNICPILIKGSLEEGK